MAWIQMATIFLLATVVISKDIMWQRPGCHKVGKLICQITLGFWFLKDIFFLCTLIPGHVRKIEIPDCVQFSIDTNACRGYCESYAVPSATFATGLARPPKPVTSVGQCCNIMETEDVNVILNCMNGPRNLTFKSATKCSCYHCKKD